jgi:probable F420-dependent oxidoreductase
MPQLGGAVDREVVADFAEQVERLGFNSIWVEEHLLRPVADPMDMKAQPILQASVMQPIELLAFAAARTERVELGTSVLVTALHRPVELARRLATLDVLSNGRVICGLGLGYSVAEFDQMDTPWEHRGKRFTDFVHALRAAWGPDPIAYDGPYFTIPAADSGPKPHHSRPDGLIPVILAGYADAALRRVATLSDGWNPGLGFHFDLTAPGGAGYIGGRHETVMGLAKSMASERRAAGIDAELPVYWHTFTHPVFVDTAPGEKAQNVPTTWEGTVDELVAEVAHAAELGIDHLIVDIAFSRAVSEQGCGWRETVERLAPLVAAAG